MKLGEIVDFGQTLLLICVLSGMYKAHKTPPHPLYIPH